MLTLKIKFDERIPSILTAIKHASNNPYSAEALSEEFEKYLLQEKNWVEIVNVDDAHNKSVVYDVPRYFRDFLLNRYGVYNFPEVYNEDYGYNYVNGYVSFKLNLLD